MLGEVTAHTTGINWTAVSVISGPVIAVVGWIGRRLGKKLDAVGEHLKAQDVRGRYQSARLARIEGKLGLQPMPIENGER